MLAKSSVLESGVAKRVLVKSALLKSGVAKRVLVKSALSKSGIADAGKECPVEKRRCKKGAGVQ